MDLSESEGELFFRDGLEQWLSTVDRPEGLRDYGATPTAADISAARAWQRTLFEGGWAGLSWPTEFGGRGSSGNELAIYAEVMAEVGLPRQLNIVGLELVGPMIMKYGTEGQKRDHLKATLRGDEVWCQLFSEPNAGSDLASLSCRATKNGDRWVVTGQKIWTSGAQFADFGLLLARTEDKSQSHRALTCFLISMKLPGIEVRPLVQMDGETKFNEVFFDEVALQDTDILDERGNGWSVAMSTLGRERTSLGAQAVGLLNVLEQVKSENPMAMSGPCCRQEWSNLWIRIRLLRMTWLRAVSTTGSASESASAVLKLVASELQRDVSTFVIDTFAMSAQAGDDHLGYQQRFLAAPGNRLAGGTSEIQRNILGERVLGLPRE